MVIRSGKEGDLEHLVPLYKSFFTTHNRFQQPSAQVVAYLQEQLKVNPLLISETKGVYDGALFLVQTDQSSDSSHSVWKFRHFAFKTEDVGAQLLRAAEDHVRKASKTAKIELTIAETEPGKGFYEHHSYRQEAILTHHYRWGETCYILAKSLS